jgi:hypothetical protein
MRQDDRQLDLGAQGFQLAAAADAVRRKARALLR